MGLSVEVGLLSDLKLHDLESYSESLEDFQAINRALSSNGRSPHEEPDDTPVWSADLFGYSNLHYLRRLAAHVDSGGALPAPGGEDSHSDEQLVGYMEAYESKQPKGLVGYIKTYGRKRPKHPYGLAFNHLIVHFDQEGMYIPQDFEPVIETDDSGSLGSPLLGALKNGWHQEFASSRAAVLASWSIATRG